MDEAARQRAFPIVETRAYFAHAAVAPLPRAVVDAMSAYLARCAAEGQFGHLHAAAAASARARLARLIGASPDEIAFVTSTSVGVSLVAAGIAWQPGDNVVIPASEYPTNVVPWLALARRGVEVRRVAHHDERAICVDDLAPLVDARTRLVALSTAHYLTGNRIDIGAIGRFLRERDVMFCLDAIQTLGVFPCDVATVDFLVAGAHKWLLGPQGIGVLYVKRARHDSLTPALLGWRTYNESTEELTAGAERYEAGTISWAGVVGLDAALAVLEEPEAIVERITALRRTFLAGARALGYRPLGDPNGATNITSVTHPSADLSAVRRRLEASTPRIVVSERTDDSGRKVLRFAPHFYNTEREVERLLAALA